jgi:hypothetical protein
MCHIQRLLTSEVKANESIVFVKTTRRFCQFLHAAMLLTGLKIQKKKWFSGQDSDSSQSRVRGDCGLPIQKNLQFLWSEKDFHQEHSTNSRATDQRNSNMKDVT